VKIKSDSKYDDTIRYWQTIDNYGYYYELYVIVGNKKASIIITNDGVSIEFLRNKDSIHTNIVPCRLFPNQKELKWDNLIQIIKILEATGCEGKTYSAEEMNEFFEKFKDQF
jgi:hypothetical protein